MLELKKPEIKKHVATIHCANELSLLQRKVSNALLYHAYPDLLKKEEYQITVGQLCKIIGYSGNNYAVIKTALRDLVTTVLEWNILDDDTQGENWTATALLASVNISGAVCSYAYSPRLKQLLASPVIYGTINLIVQARFRSGYGLALYENCARFKGVASTGWFELATFRKLMGVPEGQYKIFRDFKRRVIEKAVDEVNTYSDIRIESEFKYNGRQVSQLRFRLKERSKKEKLGGAERLAQEALSPTQQLIRNELRNLFGLTEAQVVTLFTDFDADYIHAKMQLVKNSDVFRAGQIRNLAAYLLKALRDDYQAPVAAEAQVVTTSQIDTQLETLNREYALRDVYQAYVETYWQTLWQQWSEAERDSLLQAFKDDLKAGDNYLVLRVYQQNDEGHPVVRSALYTFFEKREQLLEPLKSFDVFCEEQRIEDGTEITG